MFVNLDEAIRHALEVAKANPSSQYGEEQRQLARWLVKLKIYERRERKDIFAIYPINQIKTKGQSN